MFTRDEKKIITKIESYNLWWGIFGLCEKVGWEDLSLFNEKDEKLAAFCLCSKGYLLHVKETLTNDPEEKEFVEDIERFFKTGSVHFQYLYKSKDDKYFYEVPYDAPKNIDGIKPSYIEVWHPDEGIDLETIKDAVAAFCRKFLQFDNHIDIMIEEDISFEEALESFKEHVVCCHDGDIQYKFSEDLIAELQKRWQSSREKVLEILMKSV
ncbi:MAG: hypothetical protein WCJ37_00425 [Syntrophus sp. (in: bacteria)]